MNIIKQTVKLPHSFEDGTENRVLAFVKVIAKMTLYNKNIFPLI